MECKYALLLLFLQWKDIVHRINRSLDEETPEETHRLLQKAEGKFPTVRNRSVLLYHDGLRGVKQQLKVMSYLNIELNFSKKIIKVE